MKKLLILAALLISQSTFARSWEISCLSADKEHSLQFILSTTPAPLVATVSSNANVVTMVCQKTSPFNFDCAEELSDAHRLILHIMPHDETTYLSYFLEKDNQSNSYRQITHFIECEEKLINDL